MKWESWVGIICIWGTFDLLVSKLFLWLFGALVLKWPHLETWRWKVVTCISCIWGTFVPFIVQCDLGSVGALVSKWPVARKWLAVERNRLTTGRGGGVVVTCTMYTGYLRLFYVKGHFEVIWCIYVKMACNSKTACRRLKQTEIWDSGGSCSTSMYMGYLGLLVFQVIWES